MEAIRWNNNQNFFPILCVCAINIFITFWKEQVSFFSENF